MRVKHEHLLTFQDRYLIAKQPARNQSDQPMDLATQTHLTKLRDSLTFRLSELRADVHAAEQAQRELTGFAAHEVTDRKDEAAQQSTSELDELQEQRDLDEMAAVEAALHRLDNGTYGDCSDCGESILLQRLQAQPAAQRCARCQTSFEHARERSTFRRVSS